jgi:stage V sporulation protein AF
MRKKLREVRVEALHFGQESLCEALVGGAFLNPFPKVRYTERPDSAAALLQEGKILILCDNTPACMILPVSVFDFMQESDDFYFPPLTASYLRLLRMGVFFLTVFLTPVWYWLLQYEIPPYLSFLMLTHDYLIPIFVQLFLVEFAIDGLKLASLNTPSMLNNSLAVVGGLILGDFAVEIGWLIPEVILYMAFAAIANFTQRSYELGYAIKFLRIMLLILTSLFGIWGYAGGFVLILILCATNATLNGKRNYLYPLIPFNGKALLSLFIRLRKDRIAGAEGVRKEEWQEQ